MLRPIDKDLWFDRHFLPQSVKIVGKLPQMYTVSDSLPDVVGGTFLSMERWQSGHWVEGEFYGGCIENEAFVFAR